MLTFDTGIHICHRIQWYRWFGCIVLIKLVRCQFSIEFWTGCKKITHDLMQSFMCCIITQILGDPSVQDMPLPWLQYHYFVSTSRNGAGTGVAYRKISLLCIIPVKNKTHSFNTNTHGIWVWWTKEPCHFWSILQYTIKTKGRVFRGGGTSWHCRWSVEEGKLWHNNMATLAIYAIVHWCHGTTSLPLLCPPLAASDPICLFCLCSAPTLMCTCATCTTTLRPLSD